MSTTQEKISAGMWGWSHFCKNDNSIKNQAFLYLLGHSFYTLGAHGRRSSMNFRFLSSICCGISESRRLKYSNVFNPFAFAVCTKLYRMALVFALLEDSIRTKFFRPIVNGRIALFCIVVVHRDTAV